METASEVGVQLKEGYNGDIKSKDAGYIGGNMVRKMVSLRESRAACKQWQVKEVGQNIKRPSVPAQLSAGDNCDYKAKGEQTGSGMVDRMDEDHEIKAESSALPRRITNTTADITAIKAAMQLLYC